MMMEGGEKGRKDVKEARDGGREKEEAQRDEGGEERREENECGMGLIMVTYKGVGVHSSSRNLSTNQILNSRNL